MTDDEEFAEFRRGMERLTKRFPDFEWHCYSTTDILYDIAIPLLNRVEELEASAQRWREPPLPV